MANNCSSVEFRCALDATFSQKILENLPEWKTVVVESQLVEENLQQIRFFIAASTLTEIKTWLEKFQTKIKTTYNVRTTYNNIKGTHVKFKQLLHCQHRIRAPNIDKSIKNTNCQSRITVTLHSERALLKGRALPNVQYPCEVIFVMSHNHDMKLAEDLRLGAVAKEVKDKLKDLYKRGHSPATAIVMLKTDIYLNSSDYEKKLNDKYYCPEYRYCSYVYNKEFKSRHGPVDFNKNGKEFLVKKIQEYNKKHERSCVEIHFSDQDYVVSICPPLLKRVHALMPSETIFINSFGGVSHSGIGIFVLSTYPHHLPLGIIITSSDDSNLLCTGLRLLHNLLGSEIFGGNTQGPKVCLIDDCTVEMAAIDELWKNVKCYLSTFHMLQSVWRRLTSSKHNIPHDLQNRFYEKFKNLMDSRNEDEYNNMHLEVTTEAQHFSSYRKYLEHYFQKRHMWVRCFREEEDCAEIVMKFFQDKIFQRARLFNMEQLVDYVLTTFVKYYEMHLIEAASFRSNKFGLGKLVEMPPLHFIEKMLQQSKYIVLVPSGDHENLLYVVNIETLICSCPKANKGFLCKHAEWACSVFNSEQFNSKFSDTNMRTLFYKIATGSDPTAEFFETMDVDCTSTELAIIEQTNNDFDINYHISQEYISEQNSSDEALREGQEILKRINLQMNAFLAASPHEVLPAIKVLSEQMSQCNTASSFATACQSFGKDVHLNGDSDPFLEAVPHKKQKIEITYDMLISELQENGEHLDDGHVT